MWLLYKSEVQPLKFLTFRLKFQKGIKYPIYTQIVPFQRHSHGLVYALTLFCRGNHLYTLIVPTEAQEEAVSRGCSCPAAPHNTKYYILHFFTLLPAIQPNYHHWPVVWLRESIGVDPFSPIPLSHSLVLRA
jgi:hypothetical protein